MRIEDYPPQEPFSENARKYHLETLRLGEGETPAFERNYGDDPYQSLAVFPAAKPDGRVLVFIHGGGWTNGYKEWMYFMAPPMNAAGVGLVSVGYRLAPGRVFPAAYEDCAAALHWVFDHLAEFGGRPDKVYVGGHSAGGHYAALLATRSDWRRARWLDGNPLRGCLPVSGVFRFGEGSGLTNRPRFLGPEDAAVDRAASPFFGVEDKTPFFIAHGDRDFPHLMVQGAQMEAELKRLDIPVERLVLAGADHFGASYAGADADGVWVRTALKFMS
jgi:acetyl esterase/lipase